INIISLQALVWQSTIFTKSNHSIISKRTYRKPSQIYISNRIGSYNLIIFYIENNKGEVGFIYTYKSYIPIIVRHISFVKTVTYFIKIVKNMNGLNGINSNIIIN